MEVASAVRKVKRQFGDEYNVVINDADILEWIHEAELDIIRSTSDNDTKLNVPANQFPIVVPDRVNIKRLSVANRALAHTSLNEVDLSRSFTDAKGGAQYWYYQSGSICLWPVSDADTYLIEVLYSKTPPPMTVVAPYLQWKASDIGVGGYAHTNPNATWYGMPSFNVTFDLSIDATGTYFLTTMGPGQAAPDLHWSIQYTLGPIGILSFNVTVSDGTTTKVVPTLVYSSTYKPGTRIKIRFIYDNVIGTVQLWNIDSAGAEQLITASAPWGAFDVQATIDADIIIGAADLPIQDPIPRPGFTLYGFQLWSGKVTALAYPIFTFDGSVDLTVLPGIPLTPFNVTSGHTMTIGGDIQKAAFNEFTVPEVYHEDVVKFCLARAHNKNQNWRAAETEMEQYDRHVSTRRNEAQSTDQPQYKISDPDDFQNEYWYV